MASVGYEVNDNAVVFQSVSVNDRFVWRGTIGPLWVGHGLEKDGTFQRCDSFADRDGVEGLRNLM